MRYILIDRVVTVVPGVSLEAVKVFPSTDDAVHSDIEWVPYVPESLLVESLAQAGGILLSTETPEEPGGLVLAKVESVEFHRLVRPGERLELKVRVLEGTGQAARLETVAFVGGEVVATMTYFLARRDVGAEEDVDQAAFVSAHTERAIVLGIARLLKRESSDEVS